MTLEETIRERCCYDPQTGAVMWRSTLGRALGGARAESCTTNGYLVVRVTHAGKRHAIMAHRVAWLLMTGVFPPHVVDHIDNDKCNNAWANLRTCTQSQNLARRRMAKRALPRGVVYAAHTNKKNPYMAQIKGRSIGYFATPELASQAYEAAFASEYGIEWRN